MTFFVGEGNCGSDPKIEKIEIKKNNETRSKLSVSIRFPVERNIGEEGYKDVAGFWATVELWGKRADIFGEHIKKGARLLVIGELSEETFVLEKGENAGQERLSKKINAQSIGIVPMGISSIEYSEKKSA